MKEGSRKMLEKASELLEVCEVLFERGFYESVANRAYYANFSALNALFFETELNAKSHKGAQIQFIQHFVATGIFPENLKTILVKSYEMRQDSDYDFGLAISKEEASDRIEEARIFIDTIQNYILNH